MSAPANSNNQEVMRRQKKGPAYKFLVPLVYAPVLPLIRLSLRHRPVLRDRLFTTVLVGAFAHGFYLVYPSATAFTMLLKLLYLTIVFSMLMLCIYILSTLAFPCFSSQI